MYEVEIKSRSPEPSVIEGQLRKLGAAAVGSVRQSDEYFNHPARDFKETDEALRVRDVDGRAVVTYKGPRIDKVTKTRREIEFPLGSHAASACRECLVELGFRPVAVVRKVRSLWQLSFQDRPFEVAQDAVDELGEFTEIETAADAASVGTATRAALELAKALGLGPSIQTSYLELLLEQRSDT